MPKGPTYQEVQAVLLNSEDDPRDVVKEALQAVHEFAVSEGVRAGDHEMLAVEFATKHFHPDMPVSSVAELRKLLELVAINADA